jgi:signal transduction histidine kinase
MRGLFARLLLTAFALLICSLGVAAHAATTAATAAPIEISDTFSLRKIGQNLALLEDPSTQLTLEQVQAPDYAAQFTPSSKDSPAFGYTTSAYWARFTVQSPIPLFLTLAYAQTDLAQLWCADANGHTVVDQRAGDHVPRAEWPSSYREPTFTLPAAAQTCWLRVQSSASMQLPLTLYSQDAFVNMRLTDNTLQALYFGALLVMLIYNGVIAMTTRSLAYASYSAFLLCFGIFQLSYGGIGYAFLWRDAIGFADRITPLAITSICVSSLFFTVALLDLRKRSPRWYLYCMGLAGITAITLITPWFIPYPIAIQSILVFAPFWAVALLGSGIYLAWRGVRVAKIFLAAWFLFILGPLLFIGIVQGWVPPNTFTVNAPQIGSVIEFIMLSFALADRIKTTQAALLQAQKEIADNLRASEQETNNKVLLRTAELQAANQHIAITLQLAESAKERAVAAQRQAELQRHEAEIARQQATQALSDLQESQNKLVAAEKMASLGLLVSNVAHEINTPISAVRSSSVTVADSMRTTLQHLPRLLDAISREHRTLFLNLISQIPDNTQPLPTREERQITKQVTTFLDQAGIEGASRKARLIVKLRAHAQVKDYLPLLLHPDCELIFSVANGVADVLNGSHNIHTASTKISRIVGSLKELSGNDRTLAMFENPLYKIMENAIATLESKLLDVDVVRNYQDMPPLRCDQESMLQAFSHLLVRACYELGAVIFRTVPM